MERGTVLAVTFSDLLFRFRQFLIVIIGVTLVLALALLCPGSHRDSQRRSPRLSVVSVPTHGSYRKQRAVGSRPLWPSRRATTWSLAMHQASMTHRPCC